MSFDDIKNKKMRYYRCNECLKSGQAYIIHQYTEFLSEYDEAIEDGGKYYGAKITPALYYKDYASEYSEKQKIKIACVVRKNGSFVARFHIIDNMEIHQVRFDPCEYPCSLMNLEFFIDGVKRDYVPWNAVINKNSFIKFETNDPFVLCDVCGKAKEVKVQGIIL